ncbi:hypothetical protein WA538_004787, partial [Blastocystis sp. DL]
MLSNVIRLSSKTLKTQAVVPVRTIMTCTNHNAFTAQKTPYSPLIYEQKRTFLGPLMRYATQFLASLGGTSIRAFFQAFQQAAAQADSNEQAPQAPAQDFSLKKGMQIPEALQILNLKREEVNSTSLADRFDKYFAANDPK